jgi:hypothetical protein
MQAQAKTQSVQPSLQSSPSLTSGRVNLLQRSCACGGTPGLDGECAECRGQRLQRSSSDKTEPLAVPPIVQEVLRSSGQPLDAETRSFMEPRFGHDFSQVRVHADPRAATSARAVNALAYTVGQHLVFGAGHYAPDTTEGRRMVAHELAHVVQQEGQVIPPSINLAVREVGDEYEREAEAVADRLVDTSEPTHRTPPILQKSLEPTVMRVPIFNSTMEICRRVLTSRVFHVSQGGLVVTANARWEASPEWQGAEAPTCGVEVYDMELTRVGGYFGVVDSGYGGCEFAMGMPSSRTWTNLPNGDYYLTISTGNTNPNCCLRGEILVSQESGLSGESCTKPPPGPLEILHGALDVAGLIPALGAFPDAINTSIYLIEGNWVDAGLSAVAIIPIFGDAASIVRRGSRTVVSVSGEAVERVGRDKIAAGLREAQATRRAATEAAERRVATEAAERRAATEAADDLPSGARRRPEGPETRSTRVRVPGLVGCRAGSLFCPIDFLRQEFGELFDARRTSEFARYVRELPDMDLSLGRSLRREQMILTGDPMYAQYLREVSPSQWSEPFREALARAQRPGVDYREILVEGQRRRWPLDDIGSPWVVHHDPPLNWVDRESNQWWHPMPYRIHDAAHDWWRQLERRVKSRIPTDWQREFLE